MQTSSRGRLYFPTGPKRLRVRRVRSRTAADSVCGLDVNQSLSQPTKYILMGSIFVREGVKYGRSSAVLQGWWVVAGGHRIIAGDA